MTPSSSLRFARCDHELVQHDGQLRALLKKYLEAKDEQSTLIDELGLVYGNARADLVRVSDAVEGFEIKAGKDTLVRLPAQVAAYSQVFDFATVVTTVSHLDAVAALVPKWWGLLAATGEGSRLRLVEVRAPKQNAGRTATHLARLLWREEMLAKLVSVGICRGLSAKPKDALVHLIADSVPLEDLSAFVRECLVARASRRESGTLLTKQRRGSAPSEAVLPASPRVLAELVRLRAEFASVAANARLA